MLALVDPILASTTSYLPHSALHLAVPPSSAFATTPASYSLWSALSFYESVPRAVSPTPSTTSTRDYDQVVYSPPLPEADHIEGNTSSTRLSGPRRAPSPFPAQAQAQASAGTRGVASVPRTPPSPPRSISPPPTPNAHRVQSPSSPTNNPRLSEQQPEQTEHELDFDRNFVSLSSLRKKVPARRGPHARSAADLQKLVPPFGSPRCHRAECADSKCPACAYLRRRGDGPLRTRLLKRDKDRDLWLLRPAAYDEPWAYAEDRGKLTALQASYVLGRERALRGTRARL